MSTKKDLAAIAEYMDRKEVGLQAIVKKLRLLIKKLSPDVVETVNPWGLPTFDVNGPMCYFSVGTKHVTFGFLWGTSLDDPSGLLEGAGKNLRHVKLKKIEDLSKDGLNELILSAALFNRQNNRQTMGRKAKSAS